MLIVFRRLFAVDVRSLLSEHGGDGVSDGRWASFPAAYGTRSVLPDTSVFEWKSSLVKSIFAVLITLPGDEEAFFGCESGDSRWFLGEALL